MRKRMFAMVVVLAATMMITCVPASAAETQNDMYQYSEAAAMQTQEGLMPIQIKDVMNEYDYIVAIRSASAEEQALMSVSSEEAEYIKSNAIESELMYRAGLPEEELRDFYCYTDEAIQLLKAYDGSRLEDVPVMRTAMASLSAGIGELVKSGTRVGVIYTWTWDYMPNILSTDRVALSWEGTYKNGLTNNMQFDAYNSFCNVHYRHGDATQSTTTIKTFESNNLYRGAGAKFAMGSSSKWAKGGALYMYVNLVNQTDGPLLYQLSAHAEYAHYTFATSVGVTFPQALTINFAGTYTLLGTKNLIVTI